MMDYKGYRAQIDFDDEAGVFVGEVINTRDGITFTGRSVDELRSAFERAVDEYVEMSADIGAHLDQPVSGQIAIRLHPALHRAVMTCARRDGKSVTAWIAECLSKATGVTSAKAG